MTEMETRVDNLEATLGRIELLLQRALAGQGKTEEPSAEERCPTIEEDTASPVEQETPVEGTPHTIEEAKEDLKKLVQDQSDITLAARDEIAKLKSVIVPEPTSAKPPTRPAHLKSRTRGGISGAASDGDSNQEPGGDSQVAEEPTAEVFDTFGKDNGKEININVVGLSDEVKSALNAFVEEETSTPPPRKGLFKWPLDLAAAREEISKMKHQKKPNSEWL
eukprot:TRINITY_DN8906_c0_g3_i1.p1 TRINITY_DN8906_c0_g3~~TRINITY_DN8906_c0_g3_i1.p1  ORF type:complete len:256 (-),score=63.83 TRINITY_DN8906_c0_g3_i1:95-757(-)